MRGKAALPAVPLRRSGITPAYAGKSVEFFFCLSLVQDHPRLCGEKTSRTSPSTSFVGSPPPMRGKDFESGHRRKKGGITPAYAGKSRAWLNVEDYK